MTIRCKNIKKAGGISGLFGGTEECGVSGTIILEKTGHTVKEGSTDGKCENCNEVSDLPSASQTGYNIGMGSVANII